jgi:hypothetical protein
MVSEALDDVNDVIVYQIKETLLAQTTLAKAKASKLVEFEPTCKTFSTYNPDFLVSQSYSLYYLGRLDGLLHTS